MTGDDGGWRQPARDVLSNSSNVINLLLVWRTEVEKDGIVASHGVSSNEPSSRALSGVAWS